MSTEDRARKIAAKVAGMREDQVDAAVTAYRDALDSLYDEPEWNADGNRRNHRRYKWGLQMHSNGALSIPERFICAWRLNMNGVGYDMSKKYRVVRDKIPTAEGGFIEALRVALFEISCLGERRFDISGYPHSREHEFTEDWHALAADANNAIAVVRKHSHEAEQDADEETSPHAQVEANDLDASSSRSRAK